MSVTTRDPIAVVQAAVDLAQAARQADALITEINEGDRALGDRRLRLGRLLRDVRRQIPTSGPRARAWGEFCEARGISRDTALRHIALADYSDANADDQRSPSEIYAGIVAKDSPHGAANPYPALTAPGPQLFAAQQALAPAEKAPPKAQPQSLPAANLPPSTNAVDRWQRFLKGELTGPEALDRKRNWTEAHQESDARIRQEYSAACKAARAGGKTVPPFPPMPGYWLTAGASNDPVQAAAKAFAAAEELGRANPTKPPLLIGAVVSKLRQAGVLIAPGQDRAVFKAYEGSYAQASLAAARARPAPESAPAADPRQAALPLAEPAPYKPLFDDSPLADDAAEDEDDFDPEDGDADLIADDDDRDRLATELTRVRDELAQERSEAETLRKERDQAQRDSELAAKAHAQALKTMEGMERELAELRTRLAGAKLAEQVRDELADMVRSLRDEADACGLVTCESEADDGYCGRLALPCSDGPALCRRHQQPGGGGDPGPAKPAKAARGKAPA